MDKFMLIFGDDFELFWISNEKTHEWQLSKALQDKLSLPPKIRYQEVLNVVHPRDKDRVRGDLVIAYETARAFDIKCQVFLRESRTFARARIVGWPRIVNERFQGHIGFWRIKIPVVDFPSGTALLYSPALV